MGLFKDPVARECVIKHDVVLVHINRKPAFFARVESITADKPGWWSINFTKLSVPCTKYTWLLDDSQLCCSEFTLKGVPHQLEIVTMEEEPIPEGKTGHVKKTFRPGRKVIPLFGPREPYIPTYKNEGDSI